MDSGHLEIRPEIGDESLRRWSREFPYPLTPNIASAVGWRLQHETAGVHNFRKQLVWISVTVLFLLTLLMAVPEVRAQVLEFLQIGAIRIQVTEPSPTPTQEAAQPAGAVATAVLNPTARTYPSLADLSGETSLAEAQEQLGFPIRLPTYPPDLGEPERVFLQDLGGPAVLLVWTNPKDPDVIRLDLLLMGQGTFGEKTVTKVIETTTVSGHQAFWTEGPHILQLGGNTFGEVPLVVEGHVLIWQEDQITYRLESDLTMEMAVRIAESLSTEPLTPQTLQTATPEVVNLPGKDTDVSAELPVTATPGLNDSTYENCPVTQVQDPPFVPPSPYSAVAPYEGEFWYGTQELWTMLRENGVWWGLPDHGDHYVQKVFWWNAGYDWQAEPVPVFKVTARRLDGPAPEFETSRATNAFADFGSAILTGVEIPGLGCWEFTGSYRGHSLSFVVWVEP